MPLGGGNFTLQNKILPGAYINFVSAQAGVAAGSRGIVSLPLELPWGADEAIIAMDAADFNRNSLKTFGYYATAPQLLLVREALKRAKTILAYRVNQGGQKAAAAIGGLACTAKYTGSRGNDIRVAVVENPDGGFDIITYLEFEELHRQKVETATAVQPNDFVDFAPEGDLTAAVTAPLSGGTNGETTGGAYAKYLATLEVEGFNTLGYPGTDAETKALFVAFTKRLRDDEGKKVTCVLTGSPADHEGILNVKNGVVLEDGSTIPPQQAVAWVAGATAGAQINESLTNTAYEGAVDAWPKYTKGQYEAAIRAGEFCFYGDSGKARVVSDINSLTTFAGGKTQDWAGNRVVRVLDGWGNDIARIFGQSYIGLVTNNDTGRQLFKADLVSLASQYQEIGAISGFSSYDLAIRQGEGKRDVYVECVIQPNDSMEKLYMVAHVQ